ncbi:LysE family translocator [Bradyrhizobium sp. SYSU BS000235]|uniref:LysE family translocator n=1 Tax=Bradyrhizobium sp. SYSU BS000235 TaxID=3411332 RepID=UPI003C7491B2
MISHELLIAFIVFAAAALFTPGPNNIMLMGSGLNYGFRRTLPHVAGVTLGFSFLVAVIGFGLGAVFAAYPILHTILKYAGAAYLVYLAIVIGMSGPSDAKSAADSKPMTFLGAAMFQWVNVKGWVIAVGAIAAYAAVAAYPLNIVMLSVLLFLIGLASSMTWVLLGTSLQSLVRSPQAVRIFNIVMAVLLLASLYPVLKEP